MLTIKSTTGRVMKQARTFKRAMVIAAKLAAHRAYHDRWERLLIIDADGNVIQVL